jgi:hypothetical protein
VLRLPPHDRRGSGSEALGRKRNLLSSYLEGFVVLTPGDINEEAQRMVSEERMDHVRDDVAVEREVHEVREAEHREHPGFWRRLTRRLRGGAA